MNKAARNYLKRVREAMQTSPSEMPRTEYIEALEELAADIEAKLGALRHETADD